MPLILDENITYLKGVGPQKADILASELGLKTYGDLLYHFPYKYIDKTKYYTIRELNGTMSFVQVKGKIIHLETLGEGRKQRLSATLHDSSGTIKLIWFKGLKWVKQQLKANEEYVVFGKPTSFNNQLNITHPEIEELKKHDSKPDFNLQSFYHTTEKMKTRFLNSKAIHNFQLSLLPLIKTKLTETLPAYLIAKHKLLSLYESLYNIHLPLSPELLQKAQFRLKLEELLYIQLKILRLKNYQNNSISGFNLDKVGDFFNNFYKEHIPFELTNAQKKVLREIRHNTNTGKQMNRLLQGDVGSGKTLVALMTMLLAIDNEFQACIMAPTGILANQHLESISEMVSSLGIKVELLTGSTKQKDRRIIHENLIRGETKILIGTHALIEDTVRFKNLGMVIIDEQHRFGVAQRAKLWKKNTKAPHVLVMTATPIPRTLAMTLYGDLDVSVIDELPPGRKPIQTIHYHDSKRLRVFGFIKEQIDIGRQVYMVYPLIKESEALDYKDLEDGLESISRAFPPPKYSISVVHGKMKPTEKDKAMDLFVRKQTQIMIATTVIEVGVNVPNASVMVIESAERFGLSQLHQLRGRVGRGAEQSYCILMTGNKLTNDGRKRIETMVNTNDGFEISEVDLKLRGPGDIEGTQQSGIPLDLKIANLGKDSQIVQFARNIAEEILANDPKLEKPENYVLKKYIEQKWKYEFNWSLIS
ncbi:MAG: ATP-dependent DNA helicase RecG [Salinivirgaceae bacterium]|jgi:ATP-dependent DNA helicase RecG|nr:ATP-dependent DNA helicase RecG [Salinivirgaceae bacterium]